MFFFIHHHPGYYSILSGTSNRNISEESLLDISEPLLRIRMEIAQGLTPEGTTAQKEAELAITKQKLRDLNAQLAIYPDYIAKLQAAVAQAAADVDLADSQRNDPSLSPQERRAANTRLGTVQGILKGAEGSLFGARRAQSGLQRDVREGEVTAAGQSKAIPQAETFENLSGAIKESVDAYAKFASSYDTIGKIGEGATGVLMGLQQGFADLFTNIVTGSMSAKEAFKQFAVGIIKAMLNIIAQALAMAAIKAILRAMGLGMAEGGSVEGRVNQSAGSVTAPPTRAATGGVLSGGTAGKDSIPLMGMPGEFMVKKTAVDALGLDFLHNVNSQTENSVSASSPRRSNSDSNSGVTNIWLVTPDQVPSMGPKDVVLAVADNLNQGNGSLKMLVKAIATNQM